MTILLHKVKNKYSSQFKKLLYCLILWFYLSEKRDGAGKGLMRGGSDLYHQFSVTRCALKVAAELKMIPITKSFGLNLCEVKTPTHKYLESAIICALEIQILDLLFGILFKKLQ